MIDLLKPLAPLKFNRYSTIKNDKKIKTERFVRFNLKNYEENI